MQELREANDRVEDVFERLNLLREAVRDVDILEAEEARANMLAAIGYWCQAAEEAAKLGVALAQAAFNVGVTKTALTEKMDVPKGTFVGMEKTA